MNPIPYDATRKSLYHPGDADDFFQTGFPVENEAALCAEMSRLAYVKEETRLEQYLSRIAFQKDLAIGYNSKGTQVFIASHHDNHLTVVSYRGTEIDDPTDLFTDARFLMTPWTDNSGKPIGKVHKGFAEALQKDDILKNVIACVNAKAQSNRILLTGHSLGAALATLTASQMPTSSLYTIGSCRVGDAAFAEFMQAVSHIRFVDCCDLVTRIPPVAFGYIHVGDLRYISSKGQLLESPSEDEINADRLQARAWYLTHCSFLSGTVFIRDLADHSSINYVSGITGSRVE